MHEITLGTPALPTLLSYQKLMEMGFSRSLAYRLLKNPDCPVVVIGKRRFMDAERFKEWLSKQKG